MGAPGACRLGREIGRRKSVSVRFLLIQGIIGKLSPAWLLPDLRPASDCKYCIFQRLSDAREQGFKFMGEGIVEVDQAITRRVRPISRRRYRAGHCFFYHRFAPVRPAGSGMNVDRH